MRAGLSDVDFDFLVRNGIELNHKSLTYLDLAYNMLSDDSIINLEQIVYGNANMQTVDLSWNMLSAAGIKQIDQAVYERAKPRSSKRPSAHKSIGSKPMPKLTVKATAKEQRIALMHVTGASGAPKWAPDAPTLISQADFVTLCVAQRSPKLARVPLLKLRLLRLLTSGRGLSANMVAQQLATNFKGEDPELQAMAFDVLVRKLFSPSDVYILKDLVDEEFVHLAEEHVSGLGGSPSTSPSNKKY
jgi:multidrug efflux pump subunit AcrB